MSSNDWSRAEVTATVASYVKMLKLELQGKSYNKAAKNRELRDRLHSRTHSAVEFKHQNISAVLIENGWTYIAGYKPMRNVQAELRYEVERILRLDLELDRIANENTGGFAVTARGNLNLETPPDSLMRPSPWNPRTAGIRRDYLLRDSLNQELGLEGEKAVVEFERVRLKSAGRADLAERVEHTSVSQGDGFGYDIRSFTPGGGELYIEVKTTNQPKHTPFFVTSNEVSASEFFGDEFVLYRVFRFSKKAGLFTLRGSISASCALIPTDCSALPTRVT